MARWYRARSLLTVPKGSLVLDLGCAFGFGTRLLQTDFEAYGHDLSSDYIRRARGVAPRATFTHGPAHAVPYPDGYFDAVLLLDVLEHVPDPAAVIQEIGRLLRPGGQLIVSVPNRGALEAADSLNVYQTLLRGRRSPPTDDPSWAMHPHHEHFSAAEIERLCSPHFSIRSVRYSGFGIAELVNLPLLLLFRAAFARGRIYDAVQYLYFGAYLAEDMIETGPFGYHLMVALDKTETSFV